MFQRWGHISESVLDQNAPTIGYQDCSTHNILLGTMPYGNLNTRHMENGKLILDNGICMLDARRSNQGSVHATRVCGGSIYLFRCKRLQRFSGFTRPAALQGVLQLRVRNRRFRCCRLSLYPHLVVQQNARAAKAELEDSMLATGSPTAS